MNPTRKYWQRLACLLLALFLILLLPASGVAQETTPESQPTSTPTEIPTELPTATQVVETTPIPTEEVVATAAPVEETQEVVATDEVEATAEATAEVTAAPEETAEPEATAEITAAPEVTVEPEATAEAEFVELTETGLTKFPDALAYAAELAAAGDVQTSRMILISSGYAVDRQNRVSLQIYPAQGFQTQALERRINNWNGRIVELNTQYTIAYIPLNKLSNLLENETVGTATGPSLAISTGPSFAPNAAPIGTASTEAFNLTGVQDWHLAGFTGTGVRIGIADVGFDITGSGTFTDPDYGCLGRTPPPDTTGQNHGIFMLQLICDIAPTSTVFAYEVSTPAYASLSKAIYDAILDQVDVLIIAVDISASAPGDGTGLEDGTDDPYEAIATARAGGMVIFASAGNYGQTFDGSDTSTADGTDTRADRYASFEITDTSLPTGAIDGQGILVPNARVNMRASVGDRFFVSWNDWAPEGLGLSDSNNLEDFEIKAYMYNPANGLFIDAQIDDPQKPATVGLSPLPATFDQTPRASLFANPSYSLTIPNTFSSNGNGCPITVTSDFDGTCHVAIMIYRTKGDSPVTMQVGLTPINIIVVNDEIPNADREILSVTGTAINLLTNTGTIARPADSPDVIAVGAVCSNETGNYPLVPDSSRGTIFADNGLEALVPTGSLNQSNTKPDIVSFSYVSTSLGTALPTECDGTLTGLSNAKGIGGTSAAVAHAGAMTAVMLSNPTFRNLFPRDAAGVQAIQNYIQRRTVDLPLGNGTDSFDYDYGAGLFILGSPDYNPANVSNQSSPADLLTVGSNTTECDKDGDDLNTLDGMLYYVGQGNLNSQQDGSISNPFLSIQQAINAAAADPTYANDCIVVMPGEYVTPILIETGDVSIYSYDSVTSLSFPTSVIRVSGQYNLGTDVDNGVLINKNGGIYIDNVDNVLIQGFTFSGARTLTSTLLPSALPRQAIFADGTSGTEIVSNQFGAVTVDGSTFDGFDATPIILNGGDSGHIDNNTFTGNTGGTYNVSATTTDIVTSPVISVFNHGTSSATAAVLYLNRISGNTASDLAEDEGNVDEAYWSSLVYASDSFFDVAANTFLTNTASTMIYIRAEAGEDLRIVSNNFQNNTLSTTGQAQNDLAGALVQISSSTNDLAFDSNSVVVNNFNQSGANGAIIGRGTRTGGQTNVGRFDFTNNLIYNNTMPNGQRILNATSTGTVDGANCINLAGVTDTVPIRNNWWHNYSATECGGAMNTNGNRTDNPQNQFIGKVLNLPLNNNDEHYYILGVLDTSTDPDVYSSGVDSSLLDNVDDADSVDSSRDTNGVLTDNPSPTAVTSELGNSINMLSYPFDRAANGEKRVFDIETWDSNGNTTPPTPNNPSHDLDIGASEFVNLNILPNILADSFPEDTPLRAINLDLEIEGGFGNLQFKVLTPPDNFGVQCGPEYADDGVYFGTGAQAQTFFYCPPPNFYTSGLAAPYPSTVDIVIEVKDQIGLTDESTIRLNILPDLAPVAVDAALNSVTTFTSDDFVVVANIEQQDVTVRLRPFVNFGNAGNGNFAFSEGGNIDFLIAGAYAIDYPFTYTNLTVLSDPSDIIVDGSEAFMGADNAVFAEFDMTENEGIAILQYTVTETRNVYNNLLTDTSLVVQMKVRAVSRIPRVAGIYDDSSFAFDYTGNWSAVNDLTAVNNTLHTTNTNGAKAGFGFYGTGFTLYMKGQGATGGGNFGLNIYIDGVATPTAVTNWAAISGSTVYRAFVSDANTVFICTTDAIKSNVLSSTPADYYAITCNGFRYTDSNANTQYDDSPAEIASLTNIPNNEVTVNLVEVVNLSTKKIAVDAFTFMNDNDSATADVPFTPGFHDVDELELRGAFDGDNDGFTTPWSELKLASYSNGLAYVLTGPVSTANVQNTVTFTVTGGTGFAIGTTQESVQTAYSICVTNLASNEMTCQRFDYVKPATTPLLYGVYRPFYGLDPDTTYRVQILPENVPAAVKLVVDSLVVFEPTDAPIQTLDGSTDNADFESFVYGGPLEDSWTFATGVRDVFEGTMSSILTNLRAGPYIAFETATTVDTVYWTFSASRPSIAAMVCVDRGEGVVASTDPFNDRDVANGNCIVVNLATGDFWQVPLDGVIPSGTPADGNLQLTKTTIILRNSDFRDAWYNGDVLNTALTFEIFSIYDTGISLDRMVAIGSGVALTAGRYEEYTENIDYLKTDGTTAATIGESESATISSYATLGTDFVQVFGAGGVRDFGQGVMYTKTAGTIISFRFTGTGFAPAFRMMTASEEVEICWIADSGNTQNANAALAGGTCQLFDNSSRTTVNNGLRPILGLPLDTYRVAIRFNGDNFSPAKNASTAPDMWFDGVVIYDNNLATLDALSNDTLYQGNFSRRADFNNFAYLGTGWTYDTSARARTFSSANVDSISRGEVGATVSFETSGANAIVLTRNLSASYTPLLICATEIGIETNRFCQTVDNSGRGSQNTVTVYLTPETAPVNIGNYIVNITALTNGGMYFDAVKAVDTSAPLVAGQYDDNNPNIIYNYGSRNLVLNGDFESLALPATYWPSVGGATASRVAGSGQFYTGTAAMNVSAAMDAGIRSLSLELQGGVTYSFSGNVRLSSGNARLEISGGVCVATTDTRVNVYQPLRCTYTPAIDETRTIQFLADGGAAVFNVDDVRVTQGASWVVADDRNAFGSYRSLSTTHGAEIRFGFTGTGFGLGLTAETTGGAMMVCYMPYDPLTQDLQSISFDFTNDNCVTFDNESTTVRADTLRIVDGLASNTYAVLVRDMEDGDSAKLPRAIRLNRNTVGQIRLDYLWVFDTTTAPVVTDSGSYNESATDNSGARYLQFLPASRWSSFTNAAFSEGSYASPIDANAAASRTTAGTTVVLNVNGGTSTRIVFDLKTGATTNSNQVLACVDGVDGLISFDYVTGRYGIVDTDGTQECTVVTNLTTSRFLVLTPSNLPLLGNAGAHTIIVEPLTAGTFTLDDYQVLFNGTLLEGYYEESMVADVSTTDTPSEWTTENNALYSGGSALVLGAGQTDTLTFNFTGTGISVISGLNTTGGSLDIAITGTGLVAGVNTGSAGLSTDFASVVFGHSYSFTGLPSGTYTVTITGTTAAGEKLVLDAVEIYGTLQTLGSLYDDTEVNASGVPFLTFGPDNASWTVKTGSAAPTALNRTLHSTNRAGATLSFRMDNAKGIILYYGAGTVTTAQVCFREVGNETVVTCPPVTLTTTAGNVEIPAPVTGNWLVSITNTVTNGAFAVDAVQVLEAGLHEGIFDAADIDADSTTVYTGGAALNGTSIALPNGGSVEFDMTGVAFSILVDAAVNQNAVYTICVETDGTCDGNDIVNETFRFTNDTVPSTGISAISYAGLQDGNGNEQTVTVHITNNHTGVMNIKGLHILGQDTSLNIADTSRYENGSAQIRYLPFGSMVDTVVTGNKQSGGSEHSGLQFGEMVYFEITDLSNAATTGFEYVRQESAAMTGAVEICYGQIGDGGTATQSSDAARTANQCTTISNVNSTTAFQVAEIINTGGDCQVSANGCWVTIRNQQAKPMAFDFVRLFDAGAALTAGYYQDNYPGLNYANGVGGVWNASRVAQAAASDGFVRQATLNGDIDDSNGPVVWFEMTGTGFSIDFVNDIFSDSVKICWIDNSGGAETFNTALTNGSCQIYDNESRATKGDAQRNVLGLPDDTYLVAVQMQRDNLSPNVHAVTASPIKMNIDGVEIYDVDWSGLTPLTSGRYETDYSSRVADNRFVYVGESWTVLEGARARSNSGGNVDQVREYGGGMVFMVNNADALTLYTNLGRSNATFRLCATPVNSTTPTSVTDAVVCQDFSTNGTGNQQPLSFHFHDYLDTSPATTYLVSISSLDDLIGFIDAIEVTTASTLTEGLYEGTDVNLYTDVVYNDYVYNGRMEVDGYWDIVGNPTSAARTTVRYEGAYGWHVVGDVGTGIESQPFSLTETGVIYTAIARVKVTSGTVRLRLAEGASPVSITEFRPLAPTATVNNGDWLSLRVDFQLLVPYDDLRVRVVANSQNTVFDVDDVHLYRGGLWAGVYNRAYTSGSGWQSQTPNGTMYFSFTGTGFELGTEFGVNGGEMEICYDTDADFNDGADSCFTYQNESNRAALGVSRTVTGLPFGTYHVRVRDDEDGRTGFRPRLNASRNNRNAFGKVTVDYIRIFGDNTAVIAPSPASFFNEDAEDGAGNPYLQLYPSQDWGTVAARAGTGFSGNSYQTVIDSRGRASKTEAGQTAMLYVDVPDEGATVVLYTGPANKSTSTQFLVCAADTGDTSDRTNGAIAQSETKVGTAYRLSFFLTPTTTPGDCVLLDGTLGTALAVGPNELEALGQPGLGNVRVTFTSLTAGQFIVDGFQVIDGSTLTAGIYDSFLPDNLLNFNSTNATSANRAATGCNPDNLWCTVKVARSFGDTVLSTQDNGASLSFDIYGTGFSVITNLGTGARMRICYTQTPVSGSASFPTKTQTGGNGTTAWIWNNATQDLSLGGVWCEQVTTNNTATAWNAVTPDRRVPARAPQYGFAYYGLPMGNYSVQIMVLDVISTVPTVANAVQIDAIAVFGDYNELDVMSAGFYDNTESSVSFEPFTQWNNVIARSGPPKGPYNLTETTTTNAGAIMQMQVDGNAVTLFQTFSTRNTSDARICVIVTGAVIHCTAASATSAQEVQNPTSTAPYALAFELANFSQSGRTSYFAPIMFYGLGASDPANPHRIIIENRDHTKTLSFDAILVQD